MFHPGDVVRSRDGECVGVVLGLGNYSADDETPYWELHVDGARRGVPEGIGMWEPWDAVVVTDKATIEEARSHGLRWPIGHPPP